MKEKAIRLLVVDDERPIRRFLNAALSSEYTVFEAATGEEALAAAVLQRPDAIILDLGLPDIDGIEVIHRLREWTPSLERAVMPYAEQVGNLGARLLYVG